MKKIFFALSIILLLWVIYICIINFNSYLNLKLLYSAMLEAQTQAGMTDQGAYFTRAIRISSYSVIILLTGIYVGAGIVYMFLDATKNKVKAYQRELEKASVSRSSNASKVDVLEAKIKTLEKAFNAVIDERTKLEVQIKSLNSEIDNLNKKQ